MNILKFSVIAFWHGFQNDNNQFTQKYFKKYQYSDNYDEIDFLIIGSFIGEHHYHLIKRLNCRKILYISEPIEKFNHYHLTFKLYSDNEFYAICGAINNDYNNNRFKLPFYLHYFNYNDK